MPEFTRPSRLTAEFVRSVERPGRYGDGRGGHGLSLLVKPMASQPGRFSKTWAVRARVNGRPVDVGTGSYPVVTLAKARQRAIDVARRAAEGKHPRGESEPTFAAAVEKVIALNEPTWKNGARQSAHIWRSSLKEYALPRLGRKRVSAVTTADVMACLVPIWTAKSETARRVRQRIGSVMKWAIAQGYRDDNPAGEAIAAALPKATGPKRHFRALPHREVAGAVAAIRASGAWALTKLAFEFLVLTAARSGEVRHATWQEIDLDTAVWAVPAERMKMGREHRVPLSPRALEVLREARDCADGSGLVFPSQRGKAISDMTLSKLVREQGIAAVPHGFRSSFRDWCGDTGAPREVAEAALAHAVKGVEGAYARSDLFDRRRTLMDRWADYLSGVAAKVIRMNRAG